MGCSGACMNRDLEISLQGEGRPRSTSGWWARIGLRWKASGQGTRLDGDEIKGKKKMAPWWEVNTNVFFFKMWAWSWKTECLVALGNLKKKKRNLFEGFPWHAFALVPHPCCLIHTVVQKKKKCTTGIKHKEEEENQLLMGPSPVSIFLLFTIPSFLDTSPNR